MVCQRRDNIWASPDLYLLKGLGKQDWIDAVNNNLFDFSDKFIFGSAYPFMHMLDAVQGYKEINWNQEVQDKIFYKNALRALNLENDEIFKKLYNL
jgi:predicted TIM-barrel fold metal-dependent hydrolase